MTLLTVLVTKDYNDDQEKRANMPVRNQNLVGKQFGHLTVLAKSKERGTQGEYKWLCQCDCGKKTLVTTSSLNSGTTKSCGHLRLSRSKDNLQFTQDRHLKQRNDKAPVTNTSGYRNISLCNRHGKTYYRVSVMYNKKQHSYFAHSLSEALEARERLRKKWWPNYGD